MKNSIKQISLSLLLVCFCWSVVGNASTWIPGQAVASAGSTDVVGNSKDNIVEYFIPLNDNNYGGTYGVTEGFECGPAGTAATSFAGTCSDRGDGDLGIYESADGLFMNIFYDTGGVEALDATLKFAFADLDLIPDNDPYGFYESVSFSYWSWNGSDFDLNPNGGGTTIKEAYDDPADPNDPAVFVPNLILWSLGVSDLAALNTSSREQGGFWIQLGFGAKYKKDGTNTAEYLATALNLSPVPVPSAVWLFGTALLGFIGFSRRTSV